VPLALGHRRESGLGANCRWPVSFRQPSLGGEVHDARPFGPSVLESVMNAILPRRDKIKPDVIQIGRLQRHLTGKANRLHDMIRPRSTQTSFRPPGSVGPNSIVPVSSSHTHPPGSTTTLSTQPTQSPARPSS